MANTAKKKEPTTRNLYNLIEKKFELVDKKFETVFAQLKNM